RGDCVRRHPQLHFRDGAHYPAIAAANCSASDYFKAVETDVNVVLRDVPRLCTTAMIVTDIPAAMSPYSMAVAPELSVKKLLMNVLILSAVFVIGVIQRRAFLRDGCCGCKKKKEAMLHNWQPNCPFWTFEFGGGPSAVGPSRPTLKSDEPSRHC